jgi:hypothetical protein
MRSTYGVNIAEKDDPFIALGERGQRSMVLAARPYAFLVDVFPWLRYIPEWFPGASFKRTAALWRKHTMDMVNLPFDVTMRDLVSSAPLIISLIFTNATLEGSKTCEPFDDIRGNETSE